ALHARRRGEDRPADRGGTAAREHDRRREPDGGLEGRGAPDHRGARERRLGELRPARGDARSGSPARGAGGIAGAGERAPAGPPAREPLPTPGEALDAVDAFRRAYEAKDTAAVEGLLALDATQGGTARLAAIAPDVRALDRLEDVAYLQPAAQVEARGPAMEVRTSFEIRYRDPA